MTPNAYFLPHARLTLRGVMMALIAEGVVEKEAGERALNQLLSQAKHSQGVLARIAAYGLSDQRQPDQPLDGNRLAQWLSEQAQLPYWLIDPLKVDVKAITQTMSYEYARKQGLLPLEVHKDHVVIATLEPWITEWQDTLVQVLRKDIRCVVANAEDIEKYCVEFYALSRSVTGALGGKLSTVGHFEQLLELGKLETPDANDEHIVNIVDWVLQYAFAQRASDIHIEPRREQAGVRFRIDGLLHTVYQMPLQVAQAVISRIKILGRMNLAEKRKPQDGRLKTKSADSGEVELRLSTLPTAFGEKLVMRIFDPGVLLKDAQALGLSGEDWQRWQAMTAKTHGIVFVTGPTGSGKTTTLYSTLRSLATSTVNVCSIEDPIEMVEPRFNQMQVQTQIGLDFAEGVRALLRQDPDIIMIGEIRDLATAQMAIQAALTGHLVLSTLHTNDACSAVTRLLDLGVEPYLIQSTLLGVMAQRLVRTLCPQCKQPSQINAAVWQELIQPWSAPLPEQIYCAVGCLDCRNTGYLGRAGLYETFTLSESLAMGIQSGFDLHRFRRQAIKEGMHSLRLSGARKVAQGVTTVEEVLRVTDAARMEG